MHSPVLKKLIANFSRLPSLGPKSAKRIALSLISDKEQLMLSLIESLQKSYEQIKSCKFCGNLDSEEVCSICSDNKNRNGAIICVVETVTDLWAIEESEVFDGKYHILGGELSAVSGIMPDDLKIDKLIKRISDESIKEVIIATNLTLDGQTTAHYIAQSIKDLDVIISRPAHGVPVGGKFDYLDEGTLSIAFRSRKKFD